ncbi:hypothetical protein F4774DRAFT_363789 [Daldinia eschscholtzii]|nr:hypothetical protein F4774DRAFT_363789 [Daldinia eschscholtzii]
MYTYRIGDQRERLVFRPAKISSSTSIMSGLGRYSIELGYSYPIFGPFFFPLSSRYLIFFVLSFCCSSIGALLGQNVGDRQDVCRALLQYNLTAHLSFMALTFLP